MSHRQRSRSAILLSSACALFVPFFLLAPYQVHLPLPLRPEAPKQSPTPQPDGVILMTRDKWQELLDENARLKAQAKPKPIAPSRCTLAARLDGDVVRIHAQFAFSTSERRAVVALGCRQANPTGASLDGQLPFLQLIEDGWTVQVPTPADNHELTLDLEVPVTSKGAERGFELALPGAAITLLDLDLPADFKAARVGDQTVTLKSGENKTAHLSRMPLGPIERLEVAWQPAGTNPVSSPVLSANCRMTVQVSEAAVNGRADVTLRTLAGRTDQYVLLVPPQAEVRVPATDDPQRSRIQAIDPPSPGKPLRTIRLKEATSDPVRVQVIYSEPRAPGSNTVVVRPVALVGATRQLGNLLLSKAPDLQLRYDVRADPQVSINQRDVTEDERQRDANVAAAFTWWNVVLPRDPSQPVPGLLTLEVEKLKGTAEARVSQTLALVRSDPERKLVWRVRTRIDVTPARPSALEALQIQIPQGYEYDAGLGVQVEPGAVQSVELPEPGKSVLRVVLERQTRPFALTFEGSFAPLDAREEQVSLKLPAPLNMLDRGGDVRVTVPADFKLVPARPDDPIWEAHVSLFQPNRPVVLHERTWTSRRIPTDVDLAWRPYPELTVDGTVDLVLLGRQVQVVHRLALRATPLPDEQLMLRVPEEITRGLEVLGPEKTIFRLEEVATMLQPARDGFSTWLLKPRRPPLSPLPLNPLVLRYTVPLPAPAPEAAHQGRQTLRLAVPLARPERAARILTTVRAWGQPGVGLAPATDRWEVQPIRVVPERDSLPALILSGSGADLPVALELTEPDAASLVGLVQVDRALVRVTVSEDGTQLYQAGFLLGLLRAPYLDVELPAPVPAVGFKASLRLANDNGTYEEKGILPQVVNESGQPVNSSRIARLDIQPYLIRRQTVLEVSYQLPPPTSGLTRLLQSAFQPPSLRGDPGRFPVTWEVDLPERWLPLPADSGLAIEQRFGLRGWLAGPRASATRGDLERRLYPADLGREESSTDAHVPTLVESASALEPVRLAHCPQLVWLLLVSAAAIALGLTLYLTAWSRLWPVGVALALALVVLVLLAAVFWPGLLTAVFFGAEPGLVVLLAVLLVQWVLHHRYHRQVVFMPGFRRLQTGSSLVRGSSQRPRGEPSTVDVPPAAAPASKSSSNGSQANAPRPRTDGSKSGTSPASGGR